MILLDKEILEILKSMQNDFKIIDPKIDKNTLMLEELNTKVNTISQVQKNYMDQNEKAIMRLLNL